MVNGRLTVYLASGFTVVAGTLLWVWLRKLSTKLYSWLAEGRKTILLIRYKSLCGRINFFKNEYCSILWNFFLNHVRIGRDNFKHVLNPQKKLPDYILQTNVSTHARKRKLQAFKDFRRVCVVLIPNNDVFLSRIQKQSMATRSEMPVEAMLELKGSAFLD